MISVANEISKLHDLVQRGILTQEEFENQKYRLLKGSEESAPLEPDVQIEELQLSPGLFVRLRASISRIFRAVGLIAVAGLIVLFVMAVSQEKKRSATDQPAEPSVLSVPVMANEPVVTEAQTLRDGHESPQSPPLGADEQQSINAIGTAIGIRSAQRGMSVSNYVSSLGFRTLNDLGSTVSAFMSSGASPNRALDWLEEFSKSMKDPAKRKVIECMGVKIYKDPQPEGHPPSQEECDSLLNARDTPSEPME
ncbi:SHOCT domain-containing protein [Uliginosibacterium sp. sgz301328]|uniref:SHOCT domain-containing protein n=1 Tax=Uliginosibacterium sp. sgz301328 TaxID=3243764 RepID=UPI00359D15D9